MRARLERLASWLDCPRCSAPVQAVEGIYRESVIRCTTCGALYSCDDGVLDFSGPDDDVRVQLEREGVRRTEHDPALGGISDEFQDLSRAHGPLKDAILARPYGNASHYYGEPGYFANVRSSTAAFDFVVRHLDARPAETLLDFGADLTWSTAHMARRGLVCVALDFLCFCEVPMRGRSSVG